MSTPGFQEQGKSPFPKLRLQIKLLPCLILKMWIQKQPLDMVFSKPLTSWIQNLRKRKNWVNFPRRPRFNPWVGKICWRREWLPTPLFLPGEFHGRRSHRVAKSRTWLSHFHFHKPHSYSSHHCGCPGSSLGKGPSSTGTLLPTQPESSLKGDGSARGHVSPRLRQNLLPQREWCSILHGSLQL